LLFWNKIISQKIFNKIRNEILEENLINTYQSEELPEEQQEFIEESLSVVVEEKPSLDELLDREFSKKKKNDRENCVWIFGL
jgi:transcription termination factor NusB